MKTLAERIGRGTEPDEAGVVVEDVYRSFGTRRVLDGVSLRVAIGERVGIAGHNGSGKSTLLRCVAGTLSPDSGSIRVGGHGAGSIEARRSIGVTPPGERAFYLRLDGLQNLYFYAALHGITRSRVASVVEELALRDIVATRLDRCSTGMLQQLAFARAVMTDPAVLLLDEPTRSLDEDARQRLWSALDRRRQETAVLLATHDEKDLGRLDRVMRLG